MRQHKQSPIPTCPRLYFVDIRQVAMRRYVIIALLIALPSIVHSYFINIDANEEHCYFDRATTGTKMGLMFEVAEGGFLDIDVKVRYRYCLFLMLIVLLIILAYAEHCFFQITGPDGKLNFGIVVVCAVIDCR